MSIKIRYRIIGENGFVFDTITVPKEYDSFEMAWEWFWNMIEMKWDDPSVVKIDCMYQDHE